MEENELDDFCKTIGEVHTIERGIKMTTKELGKITFAEFGTIKDYPFLIGLQLGFRMGAILVVSI